MEVVLAHSYTMMNSLIIPQITGKYGLLIISLLFHYSIVGTNQCTDVSEECLQSFVHTLYNVYTHYVITMDHVTMDTAHVINHG